MPPSEAINAALDLVVEKLRAGMCRDGAKRRECFVCCEIDESIAKLRDAASRTRAQ
jgi:hypothetical protein